ncbi:MAG: hypothetical protein CM1200mP29_16910 [Verrucomicrobiota bacterium]|nr:MAG: hypothetical protein CM1200mP29_16910 [Verrucomicrobiota bacterium]
MDATVAALNRLARNLWWTWNQDAQDVFEELSPRAWRHMYHNAVAVLRELSDEELRVRLFDKEFKAACRGCSGSLSLHERDLHLGCCECGGLAKRPVAYFSAEFGFHETFPIAAGAWACWLATTRSRPVTLAWFCRHQPVLPRGLFSAINQSRELADRILHPNLTLKISRLSRYRR